MGLSIRKSIKVGPMRFNLSKSGVGVSAGMKGLRLGSGPRGNYIRMGIGGLNYRTSLSSGSKKRNDFKETSDNVTPNLEIISDTHEQLQEIESADTSSMVDSTSQELLEELNSKLKMHRLWPWTGAFFAILVIILLYNEMPAWLVALVLVIGVASVIYMSLRDQLKKTVVLFYEFDDMMEKAYELLHKSADNLSQSKKIWHIEAQGRVKDKKYHAGASHIIRRKSTAIRKSQPPYVKTNIDTISINVGKQTLHFFPDRVLVYDSKGVGVVGYKDLDVDIHTTNFIEDKKVYSDSMIVDKTWKYTNKNGGPDKRFKDNPELPVCLYNEIDFISNSGLNERIQLSNSNLKNDFSDAISQLASRLP